MIHELYWQEEHQAAASNIIVKYTKFEVKRALLQMAMADRCVQLGKGWTNGLLEPKDF